MTIILNARDGGTEARFPINVPELAKAYSQQRFPDDPITLVAGDELPDFDGALVRRPGSRKEWGIIYNNAITSPGRINFTQAHELGHYLLHRQDHPDGINCSSQDTLRWDSDYRQLETEANQFAAQLLMPLDDYRIQLQDHRKPTLEDLGKCAKRYGVSLTAATIRWLGYTRRRSILVASRDGFILWARPSDHALRTGVFIRTAGRPPVAVPAESPTQIPGYLDDEPVNQAAGVWLAEACEESALVTDRYDFALSLLHFGDPPTRGWSSEAPPSEDDVFDKMTKKDPCR